MTQPSSVGGCSRPAKVSRRPAQALWWLDDGPGCLEAREAAYRLYRTTEADATGAARAATALSYDALLFGAGAAVARGWWGRARDLLEAIPERAEHGWLAVREGELALAIDRDASTARSAGDWAREVGRRRGDGDLQFVGMALGGRAAISAGDRASGVPQLDTAVAAATAGEVGDVMLDGQDLLLADHRLPGDPGSGQGG